MNHRKRFGRLSAGLGASVALLSGLLVMDLQPVGAVSVTNVTAGISAPGFASGAFTATGTITNTGTVPQLGAPPLIPHSTVTISATGATVSENLEACEPAGDAVVCTAPDLQPGAAASFDVTVTPTDPWTSVETKVVTLGALPDVNAPDLAAPDDDIATATTTKTVSNVTAGVSVPEESAGPFAATGTVTNAGNVAQAAGATVAFSVTDGAVTVAGADCEIDGSGAICTTTEPLAPDDSESFEVTVTPSTISGSVITTVTTTAAQPDVNAPEGEDDVATGTTRNYEHNLDVGETACHDGETETNCMTNTSGKEIFVTLDEVDVSASCGGSPCFGRAPHASYPTEGGDPNAPLTWKITPDQKFTCAGKGNECLKHVLYYRLDGETGDPIKVPLCASYSTNKPKPPVANADGSPCLNFISRTSDGLTTFTLALVGDIEIPRILG